MRILKKVGFKIASLSGGFSYFGNYLKQKYNIDYVYANDLEVIDGKLTGRHVGDIVDGKRKAEFLFKSWSNNQKQGLFSDRYRYCFGKYMPAS